MCLFKKEKRNCIPQECIHEYYRNRCDPIPENAYTLKLKQVVAHTRKDCSQRHAHAVHVHVHSLSMFISIYVSMKHTHKPAGKGHRQLNQCMHLHIHVYRCVDLFLCVDLFMHVCVCLDIWCTYVSKYTHINNTYLWEKVIDSWVTALTVTVEGAVTAVILITSTRTQHLC